MATARPILTNTRARRVFLDRHALLEPPTGPATGADLAALIDRLGFVQVDSVNTVERAHHMILFARRQSYRPANLAPLLERDRHLWEHWTHDAAILPVDVFPHWKHRFARDRDRLVARWEGWQRHGFTERFDDVLRRIADHGPVTAAEMGDGESRGSTGWWDWHPSKTALEYLWRTGALSICRREGFRKVYDLTERVIPAPHRLAEVPHEATVDWACQSALDRLGFATSGELAAFHDAIKPTEARDWCAQALAEGHVVEIEVEGADGTRRRCLARPDLADAPDLPDPPGRLRVLSPFDPALRDRARAERLFGFHYRIEIFVPEAKRQYGYYVFPLLEGDRIVGRIDMRADRAADRLVVRALWPERGVSFGAGRWRRLEAELDRIARFAGVSGVVFLPDCLCDPR